MSKITKESHVKDVCKMGQGNNCCSYLGMGSDGWECLKESSLKGNIDARRKADTMNAKGDNCEGFNSYEKPKSEKPKNNCKHESFETEFRVGRITQEEGGDPYRFVFEAKVRCAQCKEQFEFVGLPAGDVPEHPTTNIDFTELRCPIRPNTGLIASGAIYRVKPEEVKKTDIN